MTAVLWSVFTTLSPQNSNVQVLVQPSPSVRLLSSHSSPLFTMPSEQNSVTQVALQPSLSVLLPSSH